MSSPPTLDLATLTRGPAPGSPAAPPRPSVPRPPSRWKSRILVPGVILAAAGALLLYTARDALRPAIPVAVVPVVQREPAAPTAATAAPTASPAPSRAEVIAQAAGWVEPDPFPINISALTDGVVREVLVLEGDAVEPGQVVARLVDDDARLALAAARAERDRRAADLALAEADLAAAQTRWDNPVDRTRDVAAAESALARARAELEKLPADLAAEEARLAEVLDELERKRPLADTGAVSRGELARLERRAAAQRAALDALRATRPILESRLRAAEADLAAAKENLRLRIDEARALAAARAAADQARAMLAAAEADLAAAQLRLERTEIRSPVAGVVLSRLAAPGTRLMPGGGDAGLGEAIRGDSPTSGGYAVRLYDPARLQVRVDVPLADAGKLSIGQTAEITAEVLPNRTLRGRITRILGEANLQKNTLQVKVAIDDPPPALRPEMLARVRFFGSGEAVATTSASPSTAATPALFVPTSALINRNGTTAQIWIADRRARAPVATLRTVTLGPATHDGWTETTAGLHPGDLVITSDPTPLHAGARIRITQPPSLD